MFFFHSLCSTFSVEEWKDRENLYNRIITTWDMKGDQHKTRTYAWKEDTEQQAYDKIIQG